MADNNNNCGSLACENGISGSCKTNTFSSDSFARKKIVCGDVTSVTSTGTVKTNILPGNAAGKCTCLDGTTYDVASNGKDCDQLGCTDGVGGACFVPEVPALNWPRSSVICPKTLTTTDGSNVIVMSNPSSMETAVVAGICTCPDQNTYFVANITNSGGGCIGGNFDVIQEKIRLHDVPESHRKYSDDSNIYKAPPSSILSSPISWQPLIQQLDEWVQLDLGSSYRVFGIALLGNELDLMDRVTKFVVLLSNDGITFFGNGVEFNGNEVNSISVIKLPNSIQARYVRIVVKEWSGTISMRAGVYTLEDHHAGPWLRKQVICGTKQLVSSITTNDQYISQECSTSDPTISHSDRCSFHISTPVERKLTTVDQNIDTTKKDNNFCFGLCLKESSTSVKVLLHSKSKGVINEVMYTRNAANISRSYEVAYPGTNKRPGSETAVWLPLTCSVASQNSTVTTCKYPGPKKKNERYDISTMSIIVYP